MAGRIIAGPSRNVGGEPRVPVEARISADDLDQFMRLPVSQAAALIEVKQVLTDGTSALATKVANGGSLTPVAGVNGEAGTEMRCGTTVGGLAIIQTRLYANYQPGKAHRAMLTFSDAQQEAGVIKRIGYFNDDNGLFIEISESDIRLVERNAGSDAVFFSKADWNRDKLDGLGKSGITLDLTNQQIFVIDFKWLGAGPTRWRFEGPEGFVMVHKANHANTQSRTYMASPNLPLRYEIRCVGAATGDPMLFAQCMSVQADGGTRDMVYIRTVDVEGDPLTTADNTTTQPLVALRKTQDGLIATIVPLAINIFPTTKRAYHWELYVNPTGLTYGTWTPLSNSAIEYTTQGQITGTISGGQKIFAGYGSGEDPPIELAVRDVFLNTIGCDVDGVSDIFVLAIRPLDAQTNTFYGAMTITEQY